jgi:hypothetical protein
MTRGNSSRAFSNSSRLTLGFVAVLSEQPLDCFQHQTLAMKCSLTLLLLATFLWPGLTLAPLRAQSSGAATSSAANPSLGSYLVFVNGESTLLLQQVQRFEPSAAYATFRGNTVIQLGYYPNEAAARQVVEALRTQGLIANIHNPQTNQVLSGLEVAIAAPMPQPEFPRAYYLLVPGLVEELPPLAARLTQMAIPDVRITVRPMPLGGFVSVGPFKNTRAAFTALDRLQGAGLTRVRLYYGS